MSPNFWDKKNHKIINRLMFNIKIRAKHIYIRSLLGFINNFDYPSHN